MKNNQPVTQQEKPFPAGKYLVSKTDLKGIITYANDAFIDISGFSQDELIGKNHNVVRHPDMPPAAFQYLWDTIKDGRPWRGIVKNRTKDGDHYWVDAFVVPVRENDRAIGYMSVRTAPSREQIREAETLYAGLNRSKATIDARGSWFKRISLRTRLIAVMIFMALMIVAGAAVGIGGMFLANQDIQEAYQEHSKPSLAIARMVERLGDNRAQLMLGLQHNPANPYAKLHDHPLETHIDAALKNRELIEKLRADYEQRQKSPQEEALSKAFFAARDRLSQEGNAPGREALRAGDYDKASVLLLTKVNPLYADVMARGAALQDYLAQSGEASFAGSQQRFRTIRSISIAGTLAGLVLVAIFAFFLVRAIIDPIRRAIGHFDRISQSNLTDDIDISGHDEAGQLMHALATMQVHLKVMLDDIRLASAAIDSECRRLNDEMTQVVDQSKEQRDRVQSVAATTEEFTATVTEVAASAGRTAEAAVHSRSLVSDSTASMANSMAATSRVVDAVQASSASIGELNHAIQKIGDITNTIKEIADQTNLLALNAAIEAARAGEQGRGFAVVADEVRKLAERTSASTEDITVTVTEFRQVTDKAVASMGQAVQEVEQGIGMMRASVSGLEEIKSSSEEVASMAEHIATAAREQASASDQVAANMEKISSLIDQNTSMAQDAWQAVGDLTKTASGLRAMVEQFKLVRRS
ncbi:MAG: methyl-accepting chemotaxis protein [Rhodocyclaceae bacterium]|nr:methyl-accepting chemotaxis protein [Rhodocyclaceae bacterium]